MCERSVRGVILACENERAKGEKPMFISVREKEREKGEACENEGKWVKKGVGAMGQNSTLKN